MTREEWLGQIEALTKAAKEMDEEELSQTLNDLNSSFETGKSVDVEDDGGNVRAATIERPVEFTGQNFVVWISDENHPHPYLYLLDRVTVRT